MQIRYSDHFHQRSVLRDLPEKLPEQVFLESDEHFRDALTDTLVAVKKVPFKSRERDVALVYVKRGSEIIFVTMHPLKEGQKDNRVSSGRWVPIEPESPLRP